MPLKPMAGKIKLLPQYLKEVRILAPKKGIRGKVITFFKIENQCMKPQNGERRIVETPE
jgi:hypothetical protein